ncbi:hypothetical protein [Nostoc phage N1]|nr:hypothetical protein [Nostoc phage N1]
MYKSEYHRFPETYNTIFKFHASNNIEAIEIFMEQISRIPTTVKVHYLMNMNTAEIIIKPQTFIFNWCQDETQ